MVLNWNGGKIRKKSKLREKITSPYLFTFVKWLKNIVYANTFNKTLG